jgi:hypothetical protein
MSAADARCAASRQRLPLRDANRKDMPLDLERPGGGARRERPFQHGSKRGGISLRPYLQPVVKVALRPEVLRRDQDAPAGAERARERDGPIASRSRSTYTRPARRTKPHQLPAPGAVEPAHPGIPKPAARTGRVSEIPPERNTRRCLAFPALYR